MGKTYTIKKSSDTIWINEKGGMVTGEFFIGNRTINPFYTHPWSEDEVDEDGILKWLQGDFICVPFGVKPNVRIKGYPENQKSKNKEYAHGFSSNAIWEVNFFSDNKIKMHLDYNDGRINRIEREIKFLSNRQGIEFRNKILAKKDVSLPIGIHPIFRLPELQNKLKLILPKCDFIASYPISLDETSMIKQNVFYNSITRTPLKNGRIEDLTSLPLSYNTEELVMLCGIKENRVSLENYHEDYKVVLEFDLHCFSNLILWISNKGKQMNPWNGRNFCLGIEPVTSAFDFGTDISISENLLNQRDIKTVLKIKKDMPLKVNYRILIGEL